MSTITFDPKDPSTRSFLKEIDVPEDIIESGSITISNALEYQLDDLSFETIASLDGGGSSEFISADEANKALNIFEKYGEKAKATFKSNSCPGTSVLQNMLGLEIQRIFGKIVPERICSYDDNLGPDLQKGIHFIENTVPKSLKSAGEAVGIITFKDGKQKGTGSAVLISQDGDVMTAYHVLYDGNGNFREDVSFEVYGKIVQVKQENITEANRKLDSASFKIEELKEYRTVKIAGRPPIGGEVVWAVGFPSMEDENKKTFTPGKIRQVDQFPGDGSGVMKTTALVAHGNSGGALFNNDGELVGVASSIELEGVSNIALGIPAWSNFIMPWHKYSDPPERVWKAFQSVTMP